MVQKSEININSQGIRGCTGCGVCSAVCPVCAVTVRLNGEGFLEAEVDTGKCTGCGLCKKVCSKYDKPDEQGLKEKLSNGSEIYGAFSKESSVRKECSSGGIGYEIARQCIRDGYIVCGAGYDALQGQVRHGMAGKEEELVALKGSKYIQSITGEAFASFEAGKRYTVFGTPCQIYTLHKFLELKGWRDNFLLVDFFCHGVPSKLLWDKYLRYLDSRFGTGRVTGVNFRDKRSGWHSYSMHVTGENAEYVKNMEDDLFYIFFLSDVSLNKPCYACEFRRGDMRSDIRLGDFWGPQYKDDREGVSIVTGNTPKGLELLHRLEQSVVLKRASVKELLSAQPQSQLHIPENRKNVMELLASENSLYDIYKQTLRKKHVENKIKISVKRLVPAKVRITLKKLKGK